MTVQGYASPQEKTLYHDGAIQNEQGGRRPFDSGAHTVAFSSFAGLPQ